MGAVKKVEPAIEALDDEFDHWEEPTAAEKLAAATLRRITAESQLATALATMQQIQPYPEFVRLSEQVAAMKKVLSMTVPWIQLHEADKQAQLARQAESAAVDDYSKSVSKV